MNKGGDHSTQGFTIVETLIVLAVTGFLFLMAVVAINGRQARAQFNTAINAVPQQLQQVINEIASGYYPNDESFSCNAGNSGDLTLTTSGTPVEQGANSGCAFLGKAVQFGVQGTDGEGMNTYTIAGWSQATGDIATAKPVLIARSNSIPGRGSTSTWPDNTISTNLQNGLHVVKMYYNGNVNNKIGAIAFVSSLGQAAAPSGLGSGNLISGAQQFSLVALKNTDLDQTKDQTVAAIESNIATSPVNPGTLNEVAICFASGSTDQSGLVTIGTNNRTLGVSLKIKDGQSC
jgi:type II secretory pathway pseudopilin PulG